MIDQHGEHMLLLLGQHGEPRGFVSIFT